MMVSRNAWASIFDGCLIFENILQSFSQNGCGHNLSIIGTRLLYICPCFDVTRTTGYDTPASCKETDHQPDCTCDWPAVRLRNGYCLGMSGIRNRGHHGIWPIASMHRLRNKRLRLNGVINTITTGRRLNSWIVRNRLCHWYWIVLSRIALSTCHRNWIIWSISHRCHRYMSHRYGNLRMRHGLRSLFSRETWILRRGAGKVASHVWDDLRSSFGSESAPPLHRTTPAL